MFSKVLTEQLLEFHLLKHCFYKHWNEGKLSISSLKHYATQYYQHVDAFPRYISAIHTQCSDIKARQVLLDNLTDEEKGEENHPELWLRFAESLGAERSEIVYASSLNQETKALVDGFFALSKASYAKGLGALFAYEHQVPAVATSKIDGLKKFYGYSDEDSGLKFFKVHIGADEWHSQECADLLDKLSLAEKEEAREGAITAARLLNGFLDGVCRSEKIVSECH